MADLTIVENEARIEESILQMTLPAAEELEAFEVVRIDTNGKFAKASASVAGTADAWGVTTRAVKANYAVTAVRLGVVGGVDVSSLDYGAPVYLSDTAGAAADVAGTVSKQIGVVVPVHGNERGAAADKLVMVQIS